MVKLESAENKASSLDIEVRFYYSPVIDYGSIERTQEIAPCSGYKLPHL